MLITDLAAENAELREQIALLEPYQPMAQQAIQELAAASREIERQRRQLAHLRDEYREFRERVLGQVAA